MDEETSTQLDDRSQTSSERCGRFCGGAEALGGGTLVCVGDTTSRKGEVNMTRQPTAMSETFNAPWRVISETNDDNLFSRKGLRSVKHRWCLTHWN